MAYKYNNKNKIVIVWKKVKNILQKYMNTKKVIYFSFTEYLIATYYYVKFLWRLWNLHFHSLMVWLPTFQVSFPLIPGMTSHWNNTNVRTPWNSRWRYFAIKGSASEVGTFGACSCTVIQVPPSPWQLGGGFLHLKATLDKTTTYKVILMDALFNWR